jgi:hypothetical protein
MLPFLSAVKSPEVESEVLNVFLFEAAGFEPPPFTHSAARAKAISDSTAIMPSFLIKVLLL